MFDRDEHCALRVLTYSLLWNPLLYSSFQFSIQSIIFLIDSNILKSEYQLIWNFIKGEFKSKPIRSIASPDFTFFGPLAPWLIPLDASDKVYFCKPMALGYHLTNFASKQLTSSSFMNNSEIFPSTVVRFIGLSFALQQWAQGLGTLPSGSWEAERNILIF